MLLTPEQIREFAGKEISYLEVGFEKNLHRVIVRPDFKSIDSSGILLQKLGGSFVQDESVSFKKINLTDFIQQSGTATIAETTVPSGTGINVEMTLTLNTDKLTIAVPRWSLYDGAVSDANEINNVGNDWREINVVRTWSATRGVGGVFNFKHILRVGTANVSGGNKTVNFRGDWLFLGDLISSE